MAHSAPIRALPKQYGIFQNDDPQDPMTEYVLLSMAADFNTAYEKLIEHASNEIGQRPEWGVTKEVTSSNAYDILGFDGKVRVSYQIAVMYQSGHDRDGQAVWACESEGLAQKTVEHPKEYYGMFVDVEHDENASTNNFLVGGYATLAEASDAMKRSAHSYLTQHQGARMVETSLDLVNEKGELQQRYQVVKAQWKYGEFVKEKTWLEKEAQVRARDEGYGSISSDGTTPIVGVPGATQKPSRPEDQDAQAQAQPHPPCSRDQDMPDRDNGPEVENWCICHTPDDGNLMIACENEDCAIQWYNARCVGLYQAPRGQWWCAACAPMHAPKPTKHSEKAKAKARTGAGVKKTLKGGDGKRRRPKR